jgi:hypothetical protein
LKKPQPKRKKKKEKTVAMIGTVQRCFVGQRKKKERRRI